MLPKTMTYDAQFELLQACRQVLWKRIQARQHLNSKTPSIYKARQLFIEAGTEEQLIYAVLQGIHATEETQRYCLELMAADDLN